MTIEHGVALGADPETISRSAQSGRTPTTGDGRHAPVAKHPSARIPMLGALRGGDAIALFVGFAVPVLIGAEHGPTTAFSAVWEAAVITLVGLWAIRVNGLWNQQIMAVRSLEVSHVFRALATLSALALVLDRKSSTDLRFGNLLLASTLGFLALVLWRSMYRAYLNAERRRGRYTSRVAVVGTGRHAADLRNLFVVHPELGMRVTAVLGAEHEARAAGMSELWRGTYDEARPVLDRLDVDVVVLCGGELDRWLVDDLSNAARAQGRTIFVDPGLSGIDFRRVRTTSIGYQPLLEMSAPTLSRLQAGIKRAFDIAVAGLIAVLSAPVLAPDRPRHQARGSRPGALPAGPRRP